MQAEKRGRSRTRSSSGPRGMSISRSRYRSPSSMRAAYLPFTAETKYFDTAQTQTVANAADWTGTEVPCGSYIQADGTTVGAYTDSALIPSAIGAGYGQVVGAKYKIKKIRVRGVVASQVLADSADVPAPIVVRVALIHDTRPNGAQAQGEEVFTDMGGSDQDNFSFLAMGAGQAGRFRILKDFMTVLQPAASGTDGTNTNSVVRQGALFSFTWKPKVPLEILLKANSATPAIASLSSGNIFLLAHCDGQTPATVIKSCARCYYMG